ncbi:MAG: 30S ribosomal protein S20 [Chloroflexi bacterium]|nr:30S ribosomal protein S20 [Chloroflexota bacterium]
MPVTKSAEREMRAAERRQLRNRPVRTLAKTRIDKVEQSIAAGDLEKARAAVTEAVSALDKAVEKGVLHRNNAARRKARLLKKLNAAAAAASQKSGEAATPEEKK